MSPVSCPAKLPGNALVLLRVNLSRVVVEISIMSLAAALSKLLAVTSTLVPNLPIALKSLS